MDKKANMIHLDPNFINAIESLPQFIIDANADLDMAYDWVADQTGLDSFVHQQDAWDMFYDAYEKTSLFDWWLSAKFFTSSLNLPLNTILIG